jgi:iron complex outermembrane receptor protein
MKKMLIYLFVFPISASLAQGIKDTIRLDEVVKIEQAPANNDASPFTDVKYRQGERLSDALNEFSSVYVKSYGSGGLASLAIQGTSAEQTAIEWNGVKINAPSLGQVDLSLFMLGMQDELQLVRTGYEGTIGGTLQMNNEVKRDSGFSIGATLRAGSFGTYEAAADADYAKDKFSGATKFSFISAQNNFPYTNNYAAGNPTVIQTNGTVRQFSVLQQLNAKINPANELSFFVWYSDADRQIPPIMSQPADKQVQDDYSIRTMATWQGMIKKWKLKLTSAYLDDWMRYTDPNALLNEVYVTHALRNNFDCSYTFPFNLSWKAELNYDHEWANINEYGSVKTRDIVGLKTYADYYFLNGFKLHAGFREDLENKQLSAFSPELGLNYTGKINALNRYVLGFVASRDFRFPTMDELYWIPGGNPDLQEEKSWNGTIQAKYDYRKMVDVTLSDFYIYVDNWIQWIPDGDNWDAENFRRVFSRGLEASLHLSNADETRPDKFAVHFSASYTYTRATNLDAFSATDASKGMQMIYVPYHNAMAGLQFEYRRFYIRSVNNYTGMVYTATDNSQSLNGYFTSNLEAGKDFVIKHINVGCSFKVSNIGNLQYQVVAQRPMPGRSFEGTIRFKFMS